jgi:hypothetical protein
VKTLQINYDLNAPGRNYQPIYDYIKKHTWAHPMDSMWFIRTEKSAERVCRDLLQLVDRNDDLAVLDVTNCGWWARMNDEMLRWMKRYVGSGVVV